MKRLQVLLFGSFFCFSASVFACVNDELEVMPPDSAGVKVGPYLAYPYFEQADLYEHLRNLRKQYDSISDWQTLNSMAVTCMRIGDPTTAREYLVQLLADSIHEYSVYANLGTAYELLGQNDSALYWIHRAVVKNPESHKGSEWIHEQILRYKISKARNADYNASSSVLSLDFGMADLPVNTYNLELKELRQQLEYQLDERLYFVDSADEVAALLFFDYANVLALESSLEDALVYYKLARSYGMNAVLLDARMERLEDMDAADLKKKASDFEAAEVDFEEKKVNVYLVAGILALLAVGGVYLVLRRKGQA